MRYLLDTHVLLWACADSKKLKAPVKQIIESSDHIIFVSLASLWELRIKESIGKVTLPRGFYNGLTKAGFEILNMTLDHIHMVGKLPLHHRDPFDRMLIAQCLCEQMTLISNDENIKKYKLSLVTA
ncbi:MAG: type II toxin-antitoxin system VapC family toxin [Deltaproteobacteria bacterium]|nr:type II toxin-antitoxin system VapC family toxin [Deltaproteobacteria bacterium]